MNVRYRVALSQDEREIRRRQPGSTTELAMPAKQTEQFLGHSECGVGRIVKSGDSVCGGHRFHFAASGVEGFAGADLRVPLRCPGKM